MKLSLRLLGKKITKVELRHVVFALGAYLGIIMLVQPISDLMTKLVGSNPWVQAAVGTTILIIIAYLTNLDTYV